MNTNKRALWATVMSCLLLSATLLTATIANAEAGAVASIEEVNEQLKDLFPRLGEVQVEPTPVPGIYQFWIGTNLNFAYYANGHIMMGEMFNTETKESLADVAKQGRVKEIMAGVSADDMIIYGPENPKRILNVFTDIDCGYCRKLHNEVGELTEAGVQVRYLAFPRAGIGSNSYKKYVSVWCSDDSKRAMTTAKAGGSVPEKSCENPVAKTHALGQEIGLRGTPMLVYDDGTIVAGYRPAKALIEEFGLTK